MLESFCYVLLYKKWFVDLDFSKGSGKLSSSFCTFSKLISSEEEFQALLALLG